MAELEIITTEDGSHSLRHPDLHETYHSLHGALQESRHVFIQHGLALRTLEKKMTVVRILEVGFGTGLNALLALEFAYRTGTPVRYETLEGYPIDISLARRLNYPGLLGLDSAAAWFEDLHEAPWEEESRIHPNFSLLKRRIRFEEWLPPPAAYDVVFFDAFAPSRQPEMWQRCLLGNVAVSMDAGGIFVTYSAMGQLKRDLKALGLRVETLAGPPGKKEMVRAIRPGM